MTIKSLVRQGIKILFLGAFFVLIFNDTILASNVTAKSCSAADIQAAVNQCIGTGGGIINIPACSAEGTWTSGQTVTASTSVPIKLKGAGMNSTVIGYQDGVTPPVNSSMFSFTGGGLAEVSGFTLIGSTTSAVPYGLRIYSNITVNFVAYDIWIKGFNNSGLYLCQNPNSPMLIHHSKFGPSFGYDTANYSCHGSPAQYCMYGIRVTGANDKSAFVIPATFGIYNPNAVFIEDNYFDQTYHPVSSFAESNVVVRHNTFRNIKGGLDGHGPGYDIGCNRGIGSNQDAGMYKYEIYDNDIDTTGPGGTSWCIYMRGGTGIITDNKLRGCSSAGVHIQMEPREHGTNCLPSQRCPHSATDTTQCYESPNQFWIWNNDISTALLTIDDDGSGCVRSNYEYFLRAPQAGDPVTSYAKYPYPHPLASGGLVIYKSPTESPAPSPPKDLRIIKP